MLSFTTMITAAVGMLAIANPVAASASPDAVDMPFAARDLSFTDSVFAKSSMEKRADNTGKQCRGNYQCHTKVKHARPSCSAKGVCGFKCLGNTVKKNGKCVRKAYQSECRSDRHCKTNLVHASAVCYRGSCDFKCDRGWHRVGDKCKKNNSGGNGGNGACSTSQCAYIQDGYADCKGTTCSYHCATYLGYTLFTNADKTAYRCVNLEVDPDNCGQLGNVCQPGYNGNGFPTCTDGACELDCTGYTTESKLNGQSYCTDQ